MEKRIIKAIIAERQQEISKIQLVERPIYFEEQANYVLVGIRRADIFRNVMRYGMPEI